MAERCAARIVVNHWGQDDRCTRFGALEEDGKWYCKQHAPSRIAEKRSASEVKRKEAERKVRWHRQNIIAKLTEAYTTEELERASIELAEPAS